MKSSRLSGFASLPMFIETNPMQNIYDNTAIDKQDMKQIDHNFMKAQYSEQFEDKLNPHLRGTIDSDSLR
jgi:hypothetical protein